MTVEQALRHHPVARWIFFSYNLSGCGGCAISESETLAEVARSYGIPLELLLGDLNELLEPPSASAETGG